MNLEIKNLFEDSKTIARIQKKLPELFQIANLESMRAGKVGMEVGSIRERIIVSFFIYKFGEQNIDSNIPITEPEMDVKIFNDPISIKTKTGTNYSGVKLIWTVDAQNAKTFMDSYYPSMDMIFVQINWDKQGAIYYLPLEIQREVFDTIGKAKYIKLPKEGTNPRGVEIMENALKQICEHNNVYKIPIYWIKSQIDFNQFDRWVDLWAKN